MRSSSTVRSEGWFARGADTVAAALCLPKEAMEALQPYRVGTEPVHERKQTTRAAAQHHLSPEEVDEKLAELEEDARAGVPDDLIAARSGLSVNTVARWRRRHDIERPVGRPPAEQATERAAVELFGEATVAAWMRTRESPVMGRWEVPQYLIRRALDYTAFAEAASILTETGLTPGRIAAALGVRPADVALATSLWSARCE
ncbi:MAG: hypothetical protein JJ863_17495 [Deltaproteobacteria bacterium]|nr:hypothetical protein [Deltaproteobacteria bacterium]